MAGDNNVQDTGPLMIGFSPEISKRMQENQREYSRICEDYVKEHFKVPMYDNVELANLLERTGGRCSFYFKQGPLTQESFLWHTNKVDERIKKQGYKTSIRYESEEPGLGILEEAPDSGLIARLDVSKKGFL